MITDLATRADEIDVIAKRLERDFQHEDSEEVSLEGPNLLFRSGSINYIASAIVFSGAGRTYNDVKGWVRIMFMAELASIEEVAGKAMNLALTMARAGLKQEEYGSALELHK